MKKRLILLLCVFILLLSHIGCSGEVPDEEDPSAGEENGDTAQLPEGAFELSDDLIKTLNNYLCNLNVDFDRVERSLCQKINYLNQGYHAVRVTFDPSNYYYVCAYHTSDHYDDESWLFCCTADYIWLGFENENQIPEEYDGQKKMVAFQINKALTCENIIPERENGATVEYYQLYETEFQNGYNINPPLTYSSTILRLVPEDAQVTYHTEHLLTKNSLLPYVELDGVDYLYVMSSELYTDGELYESDLEYEFGEYYEELSSVMISDKYSITNENGRVYNYVLIKMEDFANIVSN